MQIPHLEEVENHDLFQCSHIMREVGGEEAFLQLFCLKNRCYN